MTLKRWLGMSGTLLGSYYVFMLNGVMLHEAAHGLAAEGVGGRWIAFDINPGLGGWAWHRGVPAESDWIVTWAGLAVDFLAGALGLLFLLLLPRHLTTPRLVLFTFTLGGLGSAFGYTLQGFLFLKGDSAELAASLSKPARFSVATVLGAALLTCVVWGLRRIVFYLEEHFDPASWRARFVALAATVFAPWGVFMLLKPSAKVYDSGERMQYYGVLGAALLGIALFFTRKRPRGSDPSHARPPHAATGAIWFAVAVVCYVATATWLREVRLVS